MKRLEHKNESSEKEFVVKLFAGDKSSFDLFINKYSKYIIKTIYYVLNNPEDKEYIEECYDDTIIKILEKCNTFKFECSFKTWVMTVAKNEALDYKRKIKKLYIETKIDETLKSEFDLEEHLINSELASEINEILKLLRKEEKELFKDKYLLELSTKELCEKYFINEDTLYKRISRLRKKFNKIWNDKFNSKEEC